MTDAAPPPVLVRDAVRHELVRRDLEVLRTTRLTSAIVRVTFGGPELEGFVALGPEDHVKLFFPTSGEERVSRDYTPAAYRPSHNELDIDFVVHEESGPASRFAATAKPGDRLIVAGPRGSRLAPAGVRKFVLLADEASLPALGRWIAAAPSDAEVFAFVQSDHDDVLDYPLPGGDRVAVTRIATGSEAALVALGGPDLESAYVWAAGEATALIPVRRHLRRDLGLTKDRAKVDGYWRKGVAGLDHHAPLDPENPED